MKRALLLLLAGCAAGERDRRLEDVAKDWCMTIRASQVIPVYPLTEDLVPGDVFLVSLTADEQHRLYREKGFLPFDVHLDRLDPKGTKAFYDHREEETVPTAAFPSYGFTISEGGGFNMALPIYGIPVGLSLMNAHAADGSISIAGAGTTGVDILSLEAQVREWALPRREYLARYESHYLRVVHRVYLARELDVALRSSGGFEAGASTPDLQAINATLPGVSLKVTAASAGTIALRQTFEEPLVIGYLGFDLPILYDGTLGPAFSTNAMLEERLPPAPAAALFRSAGLSALYDGLRRSTDADARFHREQLDALASLAPAVYDFTAYESVAGGGIKESPDVTPGRSVPGEGFRRVLTYRENLESTLRILPKQDARRDHGERLYEALNRALAGPPAIRSAVRYFYGGE